MNILDPVQIGIHTFFSIFHIQVQTGTLFEGREITEGYANGFVTCGYTSKLLYETAGLEALLESAEALDEEPNSYNLGALEFMSDLIEFIMTIESLFNGTQGENHPEDQ